MADPQDRDRIRRNRIALTKNMAEPKEVLVYLNQWGVFTDSMKESAEELGSKREIINKILDDVPKRGKYAVRMLYDALVATDQSDLADRLYPELRLDRLAGRLKVMGEQPEVTRSQSAARAFRGQMSNPPLEDDSDEEELPLIFPTDQSVNPEIYKSLRNVTSRRIKNLAGKTSQVYSNTSFPKGIALIVNNVNFEDGSKLSMRKGSDLDAEKLQMLFKELSYKVEMRKNLTAEDMRNEFSDMATRQEQTSYDSFILVVLTHGAIGKLYGTDGQTVEVAEMMNTFNGTNAPFLVDKPKLFFIQACQGDKKDGPESPPKKDGGRTDSEEVVIQEITTQMEASKITETTDATNASVPTMADMLLAMATTADYVSWRNETIGTWFIQALAYVISTYAHKASISNIMTKVNNLVSKATTKEQKFKQISEWRSSLRKDFYFFPGLRKPEDAFKYGGGYPPGGSVHPQQQGQGQTLGQGHGNVRPDVQSGMGGYGKPVGYLNHGDGVQDGGVTDGRYEVRDHWIDQSQSGYEVYGINGQNGMQRRGSDPYGSYPYGPQFVPQQYGPQFGAPRYGYDAPQYGRQYSAPKYGTGSQQMFAGYQDFSAPQLGDPHITPQYHGDEHSPLPSFGVPQVGSWHGDLPKRVAHPVEETEAKYVFSG